MHFWETLKKPLMVMAPLEDVTDAAFRRMFATYGKPDVTWTEFTSADGLLLAQGLGKEKLLKKLEYSEEERPIVAQLFTSDITRMEQAAALVQELGFDGLDINMGCPDKKVEKQGCGSALIKTPEKAKELIRAAKRGAPQLPISVKTRAGYRSDDELVPWLTALLEENIAALTLHARTRKDLSLVPARWELVAQAVQLRNALGKPTLIIGNGDALDLLDAQKKVADTGCDGVMFGRALFGNPWLFTGHHATELERIEALIRHLQLFDELLSSHTHYAVMKKHFKAYISGWDHAKDVRIALMETNDVQSATHILTEAKKAFV